MGIVYAPLTIDAVTTSSEVAIAIESVLPKRDIRRVIKNDSAINDLISITLRMSIPIFLKDLLVSSKVSNVWSDTESSSNWVLIDHAKFNHEFYDTKYKKLQAASLKRQESVDRANSNIPLVALSSTVVSSSLRNWIKLLKYINKLINIKWSTDQVRAIYVDFSERLKSVLASLIQADSQVIDEAVDRVSIIEFLPKILSKTSARYESDDFLIIRADVPYSVYSQLTRQKNLLVLSNMRSMITNHNILSSTLGSQVQVSIAGTISSLQALASRRNCWLSFNKLWTSVLDTVNESGTTLPCSKDCKCPFVSDNLKRSSSSDKLPCPTYLRLTGRLNQSQETRAIYIDSISKTNVNTKFWISELDQLTKSEK